MKKVLIALIVLSTALSFACTRKSHCPGLGQQKAADLSLFDEEGNLKEDKKKEKKSKNGLVNKKEPKGIHKRKLP